VTARRVAFVLGANGGIGGAICRALGGDGFAVVPAARHAARLEELAGALRADGVDVPLVLPVDATDDAAVRAAVDAAAGAGELAVAVNNVGQGHQPTPLAEFDQDAFDALTSVNFRSVAVALRAELIALRASSGPRAVVNVVSSAGTSGSPGMSAYGAAKHAVVGLTRVAAIDEARGGIRVNAVAPGPIESGPIMSQDASVREQVGRYMPMGRMGRAEEVAEAVRWLASGATYTTGAVIPVDGGKSA
jgi:2-dehydro-3-deoxy-L-rhamnonate dehydrogenase (NAD+)